MCVVTVPRNQNDYNIKYDWPNNSIVSHLYKYLLYYNGSILLKVHNNNEIKN